MSAKNKQSLKSIYDNLGAFLAEVGEENETEETEMTKAEIETMVAEAVTKALGEAQPTATALAADEPSTAPITEEAVEKMVADAVAKALAPQQEEKKLTAEDVSAMVEKAVKKAVDPILKARALPTALDGEDTEPVEKNETHYLAGIL